MKEIKIGLIGFGTVGSGLAEVLHKQSERLKKRVGATIRLSKVADIHVTSLPDYLSNVTLTDNADDIFSDPEIDIVVELIGGIEPAKTFILKAINSGKHVVTANKALLSQHGKEISEAAAARNVEVGFEASVGGGIPIIKSMKEGLVANKIISIMGDHERDRQLYSYGDDGSRNPFRRGAEDCPEKRFRRSRPYI